MTKHDLVFIHGVALACTLIAVGALKGWTVVLVSGLAMMALLWWDAR